MTERELIEELATLGKIYTDCNECNREANAHYTKMRQMLLATDVGLGRGFYDEVQRVCESVKSYAVDKMIQLIRNYALEGDKNDD